MLNTILTIFASNTSSIATDTDPMEVFNTSSTELGDADGGYAKNIFQNSYQLLELLFVAGIALTLTVLISKYFLANNGNSRKESQSGILFKLGLFVIFFALITIFDIVLKAIFSLT